MPAKKNKLFLIIGLIVLGFVALPATIFFFQQRQVTESQAEKTVIMSFEPSSTQSGPMQIPSGTTFTLDVYMDPGSNTVSYVKSEIMYDTNVFELAGGFIPNRKVFSQIVEAPANTPGKVITTQSIGSDVNRAIKEKTKIGTLALKVKANVNANATASVSFGPGSQVLATSANSNFDENVIASTQPAYVQINKPQLTCGTSPTDVLMIMDRSGSMNFAGGGSGGTRIQEAKSAANNFLDILIAGNNNQSGLVTYSSAGTLNKALTADIASVKTAVSSVTAEGGTCIECGILTANQEIAAKKRSNVKNAVILLTDGIANRIQGYPVDVNASTAEQKALDAAKAGHQNNNTIYFTIGLGDEVNSDFLRKLAEDSGGQYYYSPNTDQLSTIYTQISEILARGSVSGMVFNDVNGNGIQDQGEGPLSGWLLQLYPNGSNAPQAITTDSSGTYSITNLCDGQYTIKQVMRDGWVQTAPTNPANPTFTINNGGAITDKTFGNKSSARCNDEIDNDGNGYIDEEDATCHTDGNPDNPNSYDPNKDGERGSNTCSDSKDNNKDGKIDGADPNCHTDGDPDNPDTYDPSLPEESASPTPVPAPQSAKLSLTVLLHGIGNSGDNANPNANSLSNKTPLRPNRQALVEIYDVNNDLTTTGTGTITYSSASGDFKGDIETEGPVPAGKYTIKVRSDYHLTRLVGGIHTIDANATYAVPSIHLVAGDSDDNNQLDIRDYNMLLDCYSDLGPAPDCSDPAKKLATDSNDDGKVNQVDYNLFLREISTQPGQ